MALNWNSEKFPRRQTDWEEFVSALSAQQQSEPPFEDFWLEQKSQIEPLRSPGIGKIAKCLIGLANRQPEVAARAMAGHGLMVCGLESGRRIGVARIEDHQLENALHPFLGDEGPVWSARRVRADKDDREVLILVVDPPSHGDPIHVSLKASEGISDGGIYVRSRTETRSVRGREHQALVRRLCAGDSRPDLDLTVELVTPLYGARWEQSFLDRYVSSTRSALLSPVHPVNSSRAGSASPFDFLARNPFEKPETRSRNQFVWEVEEWAELCLRMTDVVAKEYLARALPPAVFRVSNNTDTYLKNVEITIQIEDGVKKVLYQDTEELDLSTILPELPRAYGAYIEPPGAAGFNHNFNYASLAASGWQSAFSDDGFLRAVFLETALRPQGSIVTSDDDSVLFVPNGKEGDHVHGTWTLTAEGVDGRYEGPLNISIANGLVLGDGLIRHNKVRIKQNLRDYDS